MDEIYSQRRRRYQGTGKLDANTPLDDALLNLPYDDESGGDEDTEAASAEPAGAQKAFRRLVVIAISLLLIFAVLATTYMPGILAAQRQAEFRTLPTPTTIPRV